MKIFKAFCCLIAFLLVACQSQVIEENNKILCDDNICQESIELFNRLKLLSEKGIMFGHQDDLAYGIGWKYNQNPGGSDVKGVCGDYPAIYGWDIGHLELKKDCNLDSVDFNLMKQLIKEAYSRDGIITISWHLNSPVTGQSAWEQKHTVEHIITGGSHQNVYKGYLTDVASFFKSLKDENNKPIPVIFRPFHELNEDWFWWGGKWCSDEDYIQLWRETVSYLRDSLDVHNLIYAYSPNCCKSKTEFLAKYPGDEWVDLIGFDIYDRNGVYDEYVPPLQKNLKMLKEIAEEHNKLYALTETGRDCIPEPDWWTEKLYANIKGSGISYVLVWRNAWLSHYYAPFPGQISEDNFKEFYNKEDILFQNDIKK